MVAAAPVAMNLAAAVNMVGPLIPSAKTLKEILTVIANNKVSLNEAEHHALREFIVKTGEATGNLAQVLDESLSGAFREVDERNHQQLIELLDHIGRLEIADSDAKVDLLSRTVDHMLHVRGEQIRQHGELTQVVASGAMSSLVILTAAIAYNYARPRTFWDVISGLTG